MEKKHENPPEKFCSVLQIMHSIDSYSVKSKYHLTIKKTLYVRIFTLHDLLSLAAHLF